MKIPGAYPNDGQVRALREPRDPARAVSEVAEQRAQPSIAMDWAAWNAKHKAAAKVPMSKDAPWSSDLKNSKPEDRTLSPDGNKLHVVAKNGLGQPVQHEFTKTPYGWQHHTGTYGSAKTNQQQAVNDILKSGDYVRTHGNDIPLPKDNGNKP